MATSGGPPTTGIVTPEAVLLEFRTAGVASRTVAELLDIGAELIGLGIALSVLGIVGNALGDLGAVVITVAVLVLSFLFLVGYPALMETFWNGRTLGKAALGLRVVTREGAPVRFRHAAIRAMLGVVEIWMFLGIPAVVSIIVTRRDQRLGDLVAGTLVLGQRSGRQAAPPVLFSVPWNWESYVQSLDVSPLNDEQYGVVRAVLLRVGELSPEARWQVSTEVATATAGQMRIPVPVEVAPEMFLTCVATAYQRRHSR
ncbi:MAG TPA: RDD family protein [Acidimicrobiales bacterium]